jgi:hypothetical protein
MVMSDTAMGTKIAMRTAQIGISTLTVDHRFEPSLVELTTTWLCEVLGWIRRDVMVMRCKRRGSTHMYDWSAMLRLTEPPDEG